MPQRMCPCLIAKINDGSPESQSIVRLLIAIDELLYTARGYLPSAFQIRICRTR